MADFLTGSRLLDAPRLHVLVSFELQLIEVVILDVTSEDVSMKSNWPINSLNGRLKEVDLSQKSES